MRTTISIDEAHGYGADEPVPDKLRGHDAAAAAYDTAHGYEGGIAALAKRMGHNANTLTHKVNLQNTTHHLTLRDAIELQWQSRNFAILHAMAGELGHTCSRATPVYSEGDPLDTLVRMQVAYADFVQAMGEAAATRGRRDAQPDAQGRAHDCRGQCACRPLPGRAARPDAGGTETMSVKLLTMVFDRYWGGPGERLLALAMADYARDDGSQIRASVAALCKKTGQSRSTVQRQLARMLAAGWLVRVESRAGRGGFKAYRISSAWIAGGRAGA